MWIITVNILNHAKETNSIHYTYGIKQASPIHNLLCTVIILNWNVFFFLPVCYKCAGEDQFAEFKEEVEQRAAAAVNQDQNESEATNQRSVASDVMQVLQQIDEAEKKQEERQKNDVDEIPDVSAL